MWKLQTYLCIVFSACLAVHSTQAQIQLSRQAKQSLRSFEDSLETLANLMIKDDDASVRKMACYKFIPYLVKALKTENSFYYDFDSLKMLSILYPRDRNFRIITWELKLLDGSFRHYGCIQMPEKQLKLFPLHDAAPFLDAPQDTILGHDHWYGAYYYNIIQKRHRFRKHYYLFGWNQHNPQSTKKVLDVLYFEENQPRFGKPVFVYKNEDDQLETLHRFIIEYKKDAGVTLNYDPDQQMIVFDHLVPIQEGYRGHYPMYIPDGSYEGFEFNWLRGRWQYIDKVYHETFAEPPGE